MTIDPNVFLAALQKARRKLKRMELQARKYRGNNSTYTEGKCEGESIGLSFALVEIDRLIRLYKQPTS